MKLLSDSLKRSAEDILFDYLDPKEGRIYNDFARCIRSVSQNWKANRLSNATAESPNC